MEETLLGSRFAAGDPTAIREVYQRYAGPVHAVGMALLGDIDLAAEVVQITLLKAWRSARSFDPSRALDPWLYAIARRVSIDLYRRERRQARAAEPDELDRPVLPVSFVATWEAFEVRAAIDRLEPGEREVVRLQHMEGFTHAEIAARLGIPLGTVKSRAHRAHARLASALSHVVELDETDRGRTSGRGVGTR